MERQELSYKKRTAVLLIADEEVLLCSALTELLSLDAGEFATQFVRTADLARHHAPGQHYDLLVLFTVYPVSRLAHWIARLRERAVKVLLVLDATDGYTMRQLGALGVDGVVSSKEPVGEFRQALRTLVRDGLKYISPLIVSSLDPLSPRKDPLSCLSAKEIDVAVLLVRGKRSVDIATELSISQKTVNTYKSRIFKKLDVSNDIQLVRVMRRHGLVL